MKRIVPALLLFCLLRLPLSGQENTEGGLPGKGIVPLRTLFHNIGWNAFHSVTYNYGLNFAAAGLGTWAFIETGLDWKLRNIAYENEWITRAGVVGMYAGYTVPAAAVAAVYISGLAAKDEKLQMTGFALTQSALITWGIQSVLKMTSGRALPGLVNALDQTRISRSDDFSGEFDWFNMNSIGGWPSGHTANAFAAAAVVGEIYHDNFALQAGVYAYAALMGLSMAAGAHWASDVFAGALIGYAVGKTVGRSYRKLREKDSPNDTISLYATYNSLGVIIRL